MHDLVLDWESDSSGNRPEPHTDRVMHLNDKKMNTI